MEYNVNKKLQATEQISDHMTWHHRKWNSSHKAQDRVLRIALKWHLCCERWHCHWKKIECHFVAPNPWTMQCWRCCNFNFPSGHKTVVVSLFEWVPSRCCCRPPSSSMIDGKCISAAPRPYTMIDYVAFPFNYFSASGIRILYYLQSDAIRCRPRLLFIFVCAVEPITKPRGWRV